MNLSPEEVPISKFRASPGEIFAEASKEPVLLTRQGRGIAIVLEPELFDPLLGMIEDLQLALDAGEARGEEAILVGLRGYIGRRTGPSAL